MVIGMMMVYLEWDRTSLERLAKAYAALWIEPERALDDGFHVFSGGDAIMHAVMWRDSRDNLRGGLIMLAPYSVDNSKFRLMYLGDDGVTYARLLTAFQYFDFEGRDDRRLQEEMTERIERFEREEEEGSGE